MSRTRFLLALSTVACLSSCGPGQEEKSPTAEVKPDTEVSILDANTVDIKTSSGKTIRLTESHPNGQSLTTLKAEMAGSEKKVSLMLEDIDPITGIKNVDLDKNGFDEICIFTTSAGSGSYGMVHAIVSLGDTSLISLSLPVPEPDDAFFSGYMGHDTFVIKDDLIIRSFPVFKEGDPATSPSGGRRMISYELENENGVWSIRAAE
jgi:hypothetical protein